MNEHIIQKSTPIVYQGHEVDWRGEELSLTGMWKATGADPQKAPAKWRSLPSAKSFIEHVEFTIGKSDSELFRVVSGGRKPGTWAHWQIGMAYAKYLDPNFHMVCNQIVRERLEGKSVAVSDLPPEIAEYIRRTDGISRMLAHKVTEMEKVVALIASTVQPGQPVLVRHGKTAGQILKMAGYSGLKGLSVWFGNRLKAFGCSAPNNACVEMGLTKARLFDPDKAELYLDNGGRVALDQKIAERKGQRRLRLVGGEGA